MLKEATHRLPIDTAKLSQSKIRNVTVRSSNEFKRSRTLFTRTWWNKIVIVFMIYFEKLQQECDIHFCVSYRLSKNISRNKTRISIQL